MNEWPATDEWSAPELSAVYDPPRVPGSPEDDLARWKSASPSELRERQDWMERYAAELAAEGVYVSWPSPPGVIRYFAIDDQRAEALLRKRCGEQTELQLLGASRRVLRPHPFGSWLADGESLHVFYALPPNGEEAGGHVAAELDDCVIVALSIVDWLGAKTLMGGFRPLHATVSLEAALGDRPVIDNFDNRVRPHWKTAAKTPRPRAQDL